MKIKIITVIIAIITLAGFFIFPKSSLDACSEAVSANSLMLISSLFPSFVCAKILIKSNLLQKCGKIFEPVTRKLFNIGKNGTAAFLLGIFSGYPMGAVCACDLYKNRLIPKSEAERLNCFCNNSSPVFIIISVGICIFNSLKCGILLYAAHISAAICVGIIFRNFKSENKYSYIPYSLKKDASQNENNILGASIKEAYDLMLYVIGFVIFFKVFLNVMNEIGFFALIKKAAGFIKIPYEIAEPVTFGIFEMVNGLTHLILGFDKKINLLTASFLIGFGGISVFLQIFGITENHGLSKRLFLKAKLLQGAISVFVMLLFIRFFNLSEFQTAYDINISSPFFVLCGCFSGVICLVWASNVLLRKIRRFVIKQ